MKLLVPFLHITKIENVLSYIRSILVLTPEWTALLKFANIIAEREETAQVIKCNNNTKGIVYDYARVDHIANKTTTKATSQQMQV